MLGGILKIFVPTAAASPTDHTESPLPILHEPPPGTDNPIDVVAIHGLGGHHLRSWTHTAPTGASTIWLRDLLPKKFPNARIMSFSYNASLIDNTSAHGIRGNANALLAALRDVRDPEDEEALKLANSDRNFSDIAHSTKGLMFFGTPHRGSDLAKWATSISGIAQTAVSKPGAKLIKTLETNSPDLLKISEDFGPLAPKYAITSFYEENAHPTTSNLVVSKMSAVLGLPHENQMMMAGDHSSMCKFGEGDHRFDRVWKAMRRMVHNEAASAQSLRLSLVTKARRRNVLNRSESTDDKTGWAGDTISYTWFEVALQRPRGRTDVGTIRIQHNRAGNPEFFEHKTRWDAESAGPRVKAWFHVLRPGDTIQVVPRAVYRCWTNIIQSASIEIQYREKDALELETPSPPLIPHTDHAYSTLDYAEDQIRVLVVEAGKPDAEIEARFEHVSLGGASGTIAPFHALSYCWGESANRAEITLRMSDQISTLAISPTVKRAIRRLRKPSAPLRIWIDAVCINQADLEERANQVSLMGQIYSRAEEVHVWLDEETLGLDEALRLIHDSYNCKHRICPGGDQCTCPGTKHGLTAAELDVIAEETKQDPTFGYVFGVFYKHIEKGYFDPASTDAAGGEGNLQLAYFLQTFFHHPWFQRVWVVQEAVLAPKTTLHSAHEAIDWNEVLLVNDVTSSPEFATRAANLRTRNSMPSVWKTLVHSHKRERSPGESGADETPPLTILQVVMAALDMKATDPRDKLFALLPFGRETGNMRDIPLSLRPDYNKPLARVMADFTRWWITEYSSLGVLSLIHRQPSRAWRRTLCEVDPPPVTSPTWAIGTEGYAQWSSMTLEERFPLQFKTAGNTQPDGTLLGSDENLELPLRGWRLGTIVALDHPPKDLVCPYTGNIDNSSLLNLVFNRMFDPSARTGEWLLHGSNHSEGEDDPYELQGIFDHHVYAHYAYLSTPEQEQYVLQVEEQGDSIKYARYQASDLPGCIEKCFFVTSEGRTGLCPWTAKQGDVVTVLHGGNVPYLLRLLEKQSADEPDRFMLVGECFVEGVMTGEVVGNGTRESEVFVLQ
ncbi:hypothetical protein OQA88_10759 [Cercophora sp. LCS_1]